MAELHHRLTPDHFPDQVVPAKRKLYDLFAGKDLTWPFTEAVVDICTQDDAVAQQAKLNQVRALWDAACERPTLPVAVGAVHQELLAAKDRIIAAQDQIDRLRQAQAHSEHARLQADKLVIVLLTMFGHLQAKISDLTRTRNLLLTERTPDASALTMVQQRLEQANAHRSDTEEQLRRAERERDEALRVADEATRAARRLQDELHRLCARHDGITAAGTTYTDNDTTATDDRTQPAAVPTAPDVDEAFLDGYAEVLDKTRTVLDTGEHALHAAREEIAHAADCPQEASAANDAHEGLVHGEVLSRTTPDNPPSRARAQLALVSQASTRIGTTLEMKQTARELIEVAVPAFADAATVEIRTGIFNDGGFPPVDQPMSTLRLASRCVLDSPGAHILFSATRGELLHPVASRSHQALCTGRPYHCQKLDEPAILDLTPNEERAQIFRDSGLGSLIMAPLIARGRCLGIAQFGRSTKREPLTDDDLQLAQELAARTAMCLDNAQLYTNERRIAVALQRRMLPDLNDIPEPSGLEITHHYRPSSRAARVGGDWFDVIPLSGHRIALVIGDIMGHDLHAAAKMGQLRTAMRTLARLDLEPVDLLTRLDDVVQRDATIQYATCVYAVYDTVTRQCSIANAGHPAPILRHADLTTEVIPVMPGVPLGIGVVGDPEFFVTELVLPEDSTLVLYTDGLIERGEDIDVGIEALRTALARPAVGVRELCEGMIAQLQGRPEDDLAVLMARAISTPGHRFARWTIPSEPRSASQARALVRRTLRDWGGLEALVETTQLLVSELVTNAIRHARGEIELRLAKGRTLVCEVADSDERMPRRSWADIDDEQGRGLTVVSACAQGWGARPTAFGKVVWFEVPLPAGTTG